MEEHILKQMITAVDEVVKSHKSDFYKYDLHNLSDWNTPEFFWSVRRTGTSLLIIDDVAMLERLRESEKHRFSLMQHPELPLYSFLYFPGEKTFHYKDGVLSEIENPKDVVTEAWNGVSKYLQDVVDNEFGDKERKYWGARMLVQFSSIDIWRLVNKAIHSEGGDSLLQIIKGFRRYERSAVNERVVISSDLLSNGFSFYHECNGKCIMNGGILFYDGKWHSHT